MNNDLKGINERIEDYKTQITNEEKKLSEVAEGKKEKLLEDVKEKEMVISEKEKRIEDLRKSIHSHADTERAKKGVIDKAQAEDKELRDTIVGCDSSIKNLADAARNGLNRYGRNLQNVLQQIDNQQWNGRKPVGPFGHYVKLKDPRWKLVLQTQLGRYMTSFVVENSADRHKLLGILKQSGK